MLLAWLHFMLLRSLLCLPENHHSEIKNKLDMSGNDLASLNKNLFHFFQVYNFSAWLSGNNFDVCQSLITNSFHSDSVKEAKVTSFTLRSPFLTRLISSKHCKVLIHVMPASVGSQCWTFPYVGSAPRLVSKEAPMTYFMTSSFVKFMFSLIRNVLVCFFQ